MTIELGRRLLSSGAVSAADVRAALFSHLTQDTHFVHALVLRGAIDEPMLAREAARAEVPSVKKVVPNLDLVARLPPGICATLLAVPIRIDPFTSTVDVAVADPFDTHLQAELAFHLHATVRILHAPISLIDAAICAIEQTLGDDERRSQPFALGTARSRSQTPAFGSVTAAIAMQVARRSSDLPIPLVRRSQAPRAPGASSNRNGQGPELPIQSPEQLDDGDPRITRDAIVLDPAAFSAASRRLAASDLDSLDDLPFPQPPRSPNLATTPEPVLLDALGLEEALAGLERAGSRDAVVQALLRGMRACAQRVAVFAVRKDAFCGLGCTPNVVPGAHFSRVAIERDTPSALAQAAQNGWFLGPLSDSVGDQILLDLLGSPSDEVALVAVRLSGRPVLMLVADQLSDTMIATRTADRLARSAAAALLRILRIEKQQGR